MNTKDTFILRLDFFPQVKMLSREQRGDLLTAIFAYSAGEELPGMDDVTRMCFGFIKTSLEANAEKYQAKCAKNRENGSRGGRPAGKANASEKNRTLSEKSDRLNEKANGFFENPVEYDTESDLDSESESESLSVRDAAAGAREREDFLKILFFEKQILRPQVELERFINHYAKCGWVDAHGNAIRNRAAALRAWSPAKEAEKVPKIVRDVWFAVFEAVKEADPDCDGTIMLTEFRGLHLEGQNIILMAWAISLRIFLEAEPHISALRNVFAKLYGPDKRLIYREPRR